MENILCQNYGTISHLLNRSSENHFHLCLSILSSIFIHIHSYVSIHTFPSIHLHSSKSIHVSSCFNLHPLISNHLDSFIRFHQSSPTNHIHPFILDHPIHLCPFNYTHSFPNHPNSFIIAGSSLLKFFL